MLCKILIHSSSHYLSSLRMNLRDEQFALVEALNEEDVEERARDEVFDLLIIDSSSQEKLFELAEKFRAIAGNEDTPVLFIATKKIGFERAFKNHDSAPVLSIVKPFSPKDLVNSANLLIKFKRQRCDLLQKNKELETAVKENDEKALLIESQRAQLFNQAKLSALGEMAGGIAHEINNPLAIISSSINLLRKLTRNGKFNEDIFYQVASDIESTVVRISKIVQGMRTISRESNNFISEEIALQVILDDVLGLCVERFKNQGVRLEVDPGLLNLKNLIQCDRVHLSQVLLNLLGNAFDAVEGHTNKWIRIECQEDDQFLLIKIIDSGNGIPKEIRDKIFNPFFTSKPIGKGTGLGLSISKTIMEKHGGGLEIDFELPNTCFVMKLPKNKPNPKRIVS